MKTTILATALLAMACAHQHHHIDHEAPSNYEDCGYELAQAPRQCDLDHSGDRAKGSIKTWTTQDKVTASDLNANFNHIHSLMVGGHGARLLDADVSASANISSSKLAAYRYLPVAWGYSSAACGTASCTLAASVGVASQSRSATGVYTVTMSTTRTNTTFGVFTTMVYHTGGVEDTVVCGYVPSLNTTTTFRIECYDSADGTTAQDAAFSFVVYDND